MNGESMIWMKTASGLKKDAIVAVTKTAMEKSKVSKMELECPVEDVD